MLNRVEPANGITVRNITAERKGPKRNYFKLTFKELLTILTSTFVPIAIGIYTTVLTDQQVNAAKLAADKQQRIADEAQQQHLYNNFIDQIYQLSRDGELNDTHNPWAFANARYRAVHRQLDDIRKALVLQFLKEKELIGRNQCQTGCERKQFDDVIRLNKLNFDRLHLYSETGRLDHLNLTCVKFDRVSLVNATMMNVDLSGSIFDGSKLNGAIFIDSTLVCVNFNGTQLNYVDFGNSNLEGVKFINIDLSTTKLTARQMQQANFFNVIMPNGTTISESGTTTSKGKVAKYS